MTFPAAVRFLPEATIYSIGVVAFLAAPPIASYAARLPRAHRRFLAVLLGLLLLGQVVNQSRLTYRFPSWAMYGQPERATEVHFSRYEGRAGLFMNPFFWKNLLLLAPFPFIPPVRRQRLLQGSAV